MKTWCAINTCLIFLCAMGIFIDRSIENTCIQEVEQIQFKLETYREEYRDLKNNRRDTIVINYNVPVQTIKKK